MLLCIVLGHAENKVKTCFSCNNRIFRIESCCRAVLDIGMEGYIFCRISSAFLLKTIRLDYGGKVRREDPAKGISSLRSYMFSLRIA